jgi:hypothetical protein
MWEWKAEMAFCRAIDRSADDLKRTGESQGWNRKATIRGRVFAVPKRISDDCREASLSLKEKESSSKRRGESQILLIVRDP